MSGLPKKLAGDRWAIRTSGLRKTFGKTVALRGIDLTVPEGAVYVLVGPNGAGKTTVLNILLDLVRADDGKAEALGLDSRADGPRLRARIGYVPEAQKWECGWMTVGGLLAYHARYFPDWDAEYAARLTERLDVALDRRYGKLSKGQSRRVQVVMALAHRPQLLILDEPTDGLDPLARETTLSVLAEHMEENATTLLISTHLVHETERLADHMGILHDGELSAQLSTEALQRSLLRYHAEVPEGWAGVASLDGSVVRRSEAGREIVWTVWGDEGAVRQQLTSAGAAVREVRTLSLEEAAVSLLSREEASHVAA
ncbi:MAG TPA: ABC transporter ATP-binding protein [Longimicrobiales bacterium]|nr:ABC transporter ATP-binding protein [Longimicrobiales bacterium]